MPPAATVIEVDPPEFLQLAGHPLRWRLLRELAESDRTVQELTGLVGEAQNLVSYHLGKLRTARLVSSRRSSADGRDSYYAADLRRIGDLITATSGALHPGLPSTSPPAPRPRADPADVLFLCTGNSARSQMAEALTRDRSAGSVRAYSAGSHPKPLHPNAIRVMREEYGIDLAGQEPKHLSTVSGRHFDRVVTLCDRIRETCPEVPNWPDTIHWSMADPSGTGADDDATYPAFQQTAAELDSRIGFLLAEVSSGTAVP